MRLHSILFTEKKKFGVTDLTDTQNQHAQRILSTNIIKWRLVHMIF